MPSRTFLERYLQGEYENVWSELLALGGAVQEEPLFSDAQAVARETMHRAADNIEILIRRLGSLGYQFGTFPDGHTRVFGYSGPHHPPVQDASRKVAQLETLDGIGNIPLSLKMFWKVIGDVDLTGYHRFWPQYSDPLIVYPVETVQYEFDAWMENAQQGYGNAQPFGIPLSPDVFHKNNVSGGEPYRIIVPNAAIDATLENERHKTTFVHYLRTAFRYGGFPGFEHASRPLPQGFDLSDLKPI